MSAPPVLDCRMYEAKFPEVDDVVMVMVREQIEFFFLSLFFFVDFVFFSSSSSSIFFPRWIFNFSVD